MLNFINENNAPMLVHEHSEVLTNMINLIIIPPLTQVMFIMATIILIFNQNFLTNLITMSLISILYHELSQS